MDRTRPLQSNSMAAMDVEGPQQRSDDKGNFLDDDGKIQRTGNVWTATAHIITAVIGSGVLALSWSFAEMGWIAAPLTLLFFAVVTYFTSRLLADCYRHPNPITGQRNYIYMEAVKTNLSRKHYITCGLIQYGNLVGTSIGYTIATAINARSIQKTNCIHRLGADYTDSHTQCLASTTIYIVLYGVIQIVLSQIPNFGELWWLSYLAAVMSFSYSLILLGLGIGKTVEGTHHPGHDFGSIGGVPIGGLNGETRALKVWNVFIALGNIAFAYSFSMILIEIEDTLKSKIPENKQMKRAACYGISTTTFFYMTVAVFGYLALGNGPKNTGNLLTGFQDPYWLVDIANTCVVIHLVGAYQVYTQPVFQFVEMNVSQMYPKSSLLSKGYSFSVPGLGYININLFRSTWRATYVVITTLIAMVLPFFNDILGIIGALGFWPLTVYFPVSIFCHQYEVPKWSKKWIIFQALSFVTFLISLVAFIGSVAGIYLDVKDGIKLFQKS